VTAARLSPFDASFLEVETPAAHMHVGWVAEFSAPADGALPGFQRLRNHIERRLPRAPRYRQKLATVPLGLHAPEWVDDPGFSIDRHVYRAPGPLHDLVGEVMSIPLRRDRPLWEMWICEDSERRRIGVAGKAHHCMVDGIAAVELASLLLDPTPMSSPGELDDWRADPEPGGGGLLARGARDRLRDQLGLLRLPLRAVTSPSRTAGEFANGVTRVARALEHSLRAAPASPLNQPLSPSRSLAWVQRPLEDLRRVKHAHGTTVNDVLLAAVAGGARTFFARRGDQPVPLKAMVPVSVRDENAELGNQISFVFAELPCEEPSPVRRLRQVHALMAQRKQDHEPEGADLAFKAAEYAPGIVQRAVSRIFSSPRTFNLVVSNIPGPAQPMYMLGCPLEAAYPVVPLADRHALSVGMTSVRDRACFGIYADRETIPDADHFARGVDAAISELLASTR
jgi:diacylglycerol O-acyltransferase / wax synthase